MIARVVVSGFLVVWKLIRTFVMLAEGDMARGISSIQL